MTHIWIRGEQRLNEGRVGVSPAGVKALIEAGYKITIEHNPARAIPLTEYPTVDTAPMGSWPGAPHDAVIMGLKDNFQTLGFLYLHILNYLMKIKNIK